MNLPELEKKLLAAGRANSPGDRVPYAFEKRVMARLAGRSMEDPITLWARALWRAAAPCAAVMLMLGIWSFAGDHSTPTGTDSFEDQFVDTMLVLDQAEETL
jgi:hypothetical protein